MAMRSSRRRRTHAPQPIPAAIACYEEVLRNDPAAAEAHHGLAAAWLAQQRFEKAESYCRQAVRYRPDPPEFHLTLGNILQKQERFPEAAASFREAALDAPAGGTTWYEPPADPAANGERRGVILIRRHGGP